MVYKGRERDKITESKFSKQRNGKERFCQDVGLRNFVFLRFFGHQSSSCRDIIPGYLSENIQKVQEAHRFSESKAQGKSGQFFKG